jgi:hypothetical protein
VTRGIGAAAAITLLIAGAIVAYRVLPRDPAPATSAAPSTGTEQGNAVPESAAAATDAPVEGVSAADLPDMLPSETTLTSLLVEDTLVEVGSGTTLFTTMTTDRPDCGGAPHAALPAAYDGSGVTATRRQEFHDVAGPTYRFGVVQAVSTFPDDRRAQAFITTEAASWAKCKYKPVMLFDSGDPGPVYTILAPKLNAGVLTASTLLKDRSGIGCQRALGSRRNVVIDVQICSAGGSAQAPALIDHIANRTPTT